MWIDWGVLNILQGEVPNKIATKLDSSPYDLTYPVKKLLKTHETTLLNNYSKFTPPATFGR